MASRPPKIFRDPLYNYVSIDGERDGWLLELLDTPEVQRLRRIHQLGVSNLAYPGADHNRLAHSLGVLHLMQQAVHHLSETHGSEMINQARAALLATALLHDVGHGPFSHLFEPCLGIEHEVWSIKIVLDPDSRVNKILRGFDTYLPQKVADLIEKDNFKHPPWQKALLSSQLDVDRLDYLRRDSLCTGAGYGHFDFFRILNTIELCDGDSGSDLLWPEKSKFAIEEYIFSRYYMYQNVYLHHTTRGFEKMIEAMWRRGRELRQNNLDVAVVPAIGDFWSAGTGASVPQYLRIEEFTVLQQIQVWTDHPDRVLSELSSRFLCRDRFAVIDPPVSENELVPIDERWEAALRDVVKNAGYDPPEYFCLRDQVKAKYHQPYFPEKESDEQSTRNAIRLRGADGQGIEISKLLDRLKPVTQRPKDHVRYYVPREVRDAAMKLRREWTPTAD